MIPEILFVLAAEKSFATREGCFGNSKYTTWLEQLPALGRADSLLQLELAAKGLKC